jgi:hypothetical protein
MQFRARPTVAPACSARLSFGQRSQLHPQRIESAARACLTIAVAMRSQVGSLHRRLYGFTRLLDTIALYSCIRHSWLGFYGGGSPSRFSCYSFVPVGFRW